MEFDPTIETLQWIISNADKAWAEGDFQALQYWEEQKQKLYEKCQQKIKFLYYSLELIANQRDALIQKVQNGEYTPNEANQISRELYKQREDILIELKRYKDFLSFYESLSPKRVANFSSTHTQTEVSVNQVEDESHGKNEELVNTEHLKDLVPPLGLSDILYIILAIPFKKLFLTTPGQIIVFIILICLIVSGMLVFYPGELRIKMNVEKVDNSNILRVVLVNNALWNARVLLHTSNWQFKSPTVYVLDIVLIDSNNNINTLSSQAGCVFRDIGTVSKLTTSYIELLRGSRESLLIDIGCLRDYFPSSKTLHLRLYSTLPNRLLSEETIPLE